MKKLMDMFNWVAQPFFEWDQRVTQEIKRQIDIGFQRVFLDLSAAVRGDHTKKAFDMLEAIPETYDLLRKAEVHKTSFERVKYGALEWAVAIYNYETNHVQYDPVAIAPTVSAFWKGEGYKDSAITKRLTVILAHELKHFDQNLSVGEWSRFFGASETPRAYALRMLSMEADAYSFDKRIEEKAAIVLV